MPSFLGNKNIGAIYFGNKAVSEISLGNLIIYEAASQEDDSNFILANGDYFYTADDKIFDTRIEQVTLANGDTIKLADGLELYIHD